MMGVILTGGRNTRLKELSDIRSNSAIPVAGKYRAIDFALSNMVNAGIINVGVLTQYSFRSLIDHLGSGKEWDLDRKTKGLFVFPPYLGDDNNGWYRGTADALHSNLTFVRKSTEDYVLIAQGNCIYNMDFTQVLESHIERDSDITMVYRNMFDHQPEELSHLGVLEIDSNNRIIDFQEKPKVAKRTTCSMGIYLMKKDLLISLLEECISHGRYDFVKDVLVKKVSELTVYGVEFKGYWRNFSTLYSYYRCNMELLNPELHKSVFGGERTIYTKIKDEPPAKFNEESNVKNSIVADGSIVEGEIENSIIFRGVVVKKERKLRIPLSCKIQ
jgi:glucose-1-phosphate adenylyltransferase